MLRGEGHLGAAVWARPFPRSTFGRQDYWAPEQLGTAVCTKGIASYGTLGHVPPLDFRLCGRVFTVLLRQD